MKGFCLALVLLPLALAAPEKRFLLDTAGELISGTELNNLLSQITTSLGSDATEQQCETKCMSILNNDLLDTACPFVCKSFQAAVQGGTHSQSKRLLFDNLLDTTQLNSILQQVYDTLGSDATEAQCEEKCTSILNNALLGTACPFVCSSFQAFVSNLHAGSGAVQKRFIEGFFDNEQLSSLVAQLAAQAGSDETEQKCEGQCMAILNNALLDTACPFVCASLQSLAQKFGHPIATAAPVQKRFVLDTLGITALEQLFSTDDLKHYVNQIVAIAGADETEAQCETACLEVMTSDLLDKSCPLLCSSFQTLVQHFHQEEATAAPAALNKRFLLDNLPHFDISQLLSIFSQADLAKYVNEIVDLAGADETEAQCETACTQVMANDLLDTACPLICNSFQALVQKFHVAAPAASVNKRFILDSFGLDLSQLLSMFSTSDLQSYINQIVDIAGADETEAQCETACLQVMNNDLLDTACPLICNSFQALVQKFHIDGQAPATAATVVNKRFILDSFDLPAIIKALSSFDLDNIVNTIGAQIGSDATEYQCEEACVSSTDLPDALCPMLCSSFQQIAQQVHITEANNTPAP